MQAGVAAPAHDLTQAVTTALVVRASVAACLDCYCAPTLACPPLACSCPAGEGVITPSEGSGFSGWQLAAAAGVALASGLALVAAGALWATLPPWAVRAPAVAAPSALAGPAALVDVQSAAAEKARAFRRTPPPARA